MNFIFVFAKWCVIYTTDVLSFVLVCNIAKGVETGDMSFQEKPVALERSEYVAFEA